MYFVVWLVCGLWASCWWVWFCVGGWIGGLWLDGLCLGDLVVGCCEWFASDFVVGRFGIVELWLLL